MIYLILAILISTSIVITFKLFNRFSINNVQAITINYVVAAGMSFLSYPGSFHWAELPLRPWFFWACIIGLFFILVFYVFALSAQKAGVAITAVTSKMSVVIPVSIGILFYQDQVTSFKIAGIIFSLLAFYLIFKKEETSSIEKKFFLFPVLLFLGNGANDSLMKHAQKFHVGQDYMLFLACIFSVALMLGIIIFLFNIRQQRQAFHLKNLLAGLILGTFNFASTYFFLRGLEFFESSVFFPIFNVSIVSGGALAGLLLFKEKLRPINWLGIFLAILTIIFIALA